MNWTFFFKECILSLGHSVSNPKEFLSDREQGHSKLNAVVLSGELVVSIAAKDRVDAVRAKMSSAREDWKTLMSNVHQRETALQVIN